MKMVIMCTSYKGLTTGLSPNLEIITCFPFTASTPWGIVSADTTVKRRACISEHSNRFFIFHTSAVHLQIWMAQILSRTLGFKVRSLCPYFQTACSLLEPHLTLIHSYIHSIVQYFIHSFREEPVSLPPKFRTFETPLQLTAEAWYDSPPDSWCSFQKEKIQWVLASFWKSNF